MNSSVEPLVYLLSPARCCGKRAAMLRSPDARFELAIRFRQGQATLGEVFSFISGLYFRGKLTYARRFSDPTGRLPGPLVIAPGDGLVPADIPCTEACMLRYESVPVDEDEPRFSEPLFRDTAALAERIGNETGVVLLGSIATLKYVRPLRRFLGRRLLYPEQFEGRGDMSRGALLLRAAAAGEVLRYCPVGEETEKKSLRGSK